MKEIKNSIIVPKLRTQKKKKILDLVLIVIFLEV